MIRAAAEGNGLIVVARIDPLLVDAADQEDLVVHGKPEQDGEQHHRQEHLDGAGLGVGQQGLPPSPLECRREHT
jgi:hypothetical protein